MIYCNNGMILRDAGVCNYLSLSLILWDSMSEILIISTTDTLELAQRIANSLVEEGDAACVNIVPEIRSIYRWEGKVCNETEFLLLIKSTSGLFESVRSKIRRLHSYQVPEVIALSITAGDPDYLDWLRSQTGRR
jgi:periplasmic divalent cation tolerance protein